MLISNLLKKPLKLYQKSSMNMSKNEKSSYFRHICANNFLLLTLLLNFECKCAWNNFKKLKTFFYKHVLEFN